jgi:hypothetical protein
MRKSIALVVVGLAAGFVIAAWWGGSSLEPTPDSRDSLTTEQRLDALEADLASEARRRIELEAEIALLNERLAQAVPAEEGESVDSSDPDDRSETDEQAPVAEAPAPRRVVRVGPPPAIDESDLVERFIAAGIAPARAQWIVARSEELRMQALQEQYDAARENRPIDPVLAGRMTSLRNELGDADYERYLTALGLPTNVQVGRVLATSPGAQAGIKAGDQIVSFDGERVFDMRDINRLTLEGEPGQMVAVDVMRDGQLMQLYVPRGPIGIMGGRDGPPFR